MNKFFILLISAFPVCPATLLAQKQNAYTFIEPNISVSYDSNYFKISDRYSNSFYETEAYDFTVQLDTAEKAIIHIKAARAAEYPLKQTRDSFIMAGLKEMKNAVNDSLVIVSIDTTIKEINGFSCIGFTGYTKANGAYGTIISGYRFADNDNTEISFMSDGKDLDKAYRIVISFLNGFKSYSIKEINHEEALIKSKYTVVVTPAKTTNQSLYSRPKTYSGTVSTKQKLEHTIAAVQLQFDNSTGNEIFAPAGNGKVAITSNDNKKGIIKKTGNLVLLNSFGKRVKLPFTFSYFNKGPVKRYNR